MESNLVTDWQVISTPFDSDLPAGMEMRSDGMRVAIWWPEHNMHCDFDREHLSRATVQACVRNMSGYAQSKARKASEAATA